MHCCLSRVALAPLDHIGHPLGPAEVADACPPTGPDGAGQTMLLAEPMIREGEERHGFLPLPDDTLVETTWRTPDEITEFRVMLANAPEPVVELARRVHDDPARYGGVQLEGWATASRSGGEQAWTCLRWVRLIDLAVGEVEALRGPTTSLRWRTGPNPLNLTYETWAEQGAPPEPTTQA